MKIREGFVSNSSSSSFLILRKNITPENLEKFFKKNNKEDSWKIEEHPEYIFGHTSMDNFDAVGYLEKLGAQNIIQSEFGDIDRMLKKARKA